MTFEQIQAANAQITQIDVKGKSYAMVHQRIKAFRMCCPEGAIETEILSNVDGTVVMKATVRDETGRILGTGHASEVQTSSMINRTSYVENCETSCIGRALGMAGFGIDTSIASAEEIAQAETAAASLAPIDKRKAAALQKRMESEQIDIPKLLAKYGVYEVTDLTEQMHSHIINNWETIQEKYKLKKEEWK